MGEDWSKYSDAELWVFIKCNRSHAFDEICHRYWTKLYHAAYKVLHHHEASSDIIQEVLADLWMKRKDAEISSLPAYLHGMVRNQVFNYLRNHKISQRHLDRMTHVVFVEIKQSKW